MEINFVKKDAFLICGYCIETTLEQNDNDVSALYDDFFSSGKEAILMNLEGSKKGYYGLIWYTQGHEQYAYLFGVEVGRDNTVPEKAIFKEIPKTTYAVAHFPQGQDIIQAWTELFYNEIPKAGFEVDKKYNSYLEYYPGTIREGFELWVPVVKSEI